ncbi:MAG: peptidoglycan DD-metalloendopeptidase family protein [Candidatus Margulisbacteria bacterium]|nr:peptidoglycan DD-metalloendopeptidase family protein [Candidatus Margulisiibacteriota bacterium]
MKTTAAALLLVIFCSAAVFADELTEEQKLREIQNKLKESKEKLLKTKAEEQAVLGKLVIISKELKRTKTNLFLTQRKIMANETQIGTLTYELGKIESELLKKEKKLAGRLEEIYKGSGQDYIQLLFSSNSMSDFFNRLYFFKKVIKYDSALVQEVRADAHQAKQKRALLQDRTREIKGLAKVFEEKKQEIATQAGIKKKAYEGLKERREDFEKQVAELERSSKELEGLILKKMAERRGVKVHGSGRLAWPLQGRLTSKYGYRRSPFWGGRQMHTGIDIATKYGTPIKSADSGEVIFSGWWDGYGKAIVIDHGRRITTVYGHMSRIYKQVGAIVAKGQVIGLVGSTGYSTGPHLHFEVRESGKPVNPMKYL